MSVYLALLLVVCSLVSMAYAAHPATGMACRHCGGRHEDHFPVCLHEVHQCHHDELCHMSDVHKDIHIDCMKKTDCVHMHAHTCLLKRAGSGSCEICCSDDRCVAQQIAHLEGKTVTVTKAPVTALPTTQKVTPSSSGSFADHLLTGPCYDNLLQGGCSDAKLTVCKDPVGVVMCPETCGLCTLLKENFRGNTTCRDQLVDGQCASAYSSTFCNGQLASIACPKTCNLCQTMLEKLIQIVVTSAHVSTLPPVTETVVAVTTTVPPMTNKLTTMTPTASTTVVTQPTTHDACFDDVNDCHSLPDVCHNLLADMICKKFCNLCDTTTVMPKITTDAKTVVIVTEQTTVEVETTATIPPAATTKDLGGVLPQSTTEAKQGTVQALVG